MNNALHKEHNENFLCVDCAIMVVFVVIYYRCNRYQALLLRNPCK